MIRSNIDNRVYFPPGEDYGNADQTTVLGMMMTMIIIIMIIIILCMIIRIIMVVTIMIQGEI